MEANITIILHTRFNTRATEIWNKLIKAYYGQQGIHKSFVQFILFIQNNLYKIVPNTSASLINQNGTIGKN